MKNNKVPDEDFGRFIYEKINVITDIQLLILKGHVLIEYSLNKFIKDCSEIDDKELDEFTFYKKIKLAKMLGLFWKLKKDNLEKKVLDINRLRNQIAHDLSYDKKLIEKLIGYYLDDSDFSHLIKIENSELENLHHVIPSICGDIIGRKLGKQKISCFTKIFLTQERMKNPTDFDTKFNDFKSLLKLK